MMEDSKLVRRLLAGSQSKNSRNSKKHFLFYLRLFFFFFTKEKLNPFAIGKVNVNSTKKAR